MDMYVKCIDVGLSTQLTLGKVYKRLSWGHGKVMVSNDCGNHIDYTKQQFGEPFSDVKAKERQHAEQIHCWAAGAIIQWRRPQGEWNYCINNKPSWEPDNEYRVKPTIDQHEINRVTDQIAVHQRDLTLLRGRVHDNNQAIMSNLEHLDKLHIELTKLESGE